MAIKHECYNFWNAFNSLILRLYKAIYVGYVRDFENIYKMSICVLFSQ